MFDKFIEFNFGENHNFRKKDNDLYFSICLTRLRYENMPDHIKQIFKFGNESSRFAMFNKLLKSDTYYICDLEN